MGGGFYSTEEGLLAPHTAQRQEGTSMRAWEVLYQLGEGLANGMTDCGVPKRVVAAWHKEWGAKVLDPLLGETTPTEVSTEVVRGMTWAQAIAESFDGE